MKKIFLILITALSLSASEYAVQVMALKKPSSLQPSLIKLFKKQQNGGAHLKIVHQDGWQKLQFKPFSIPSNAYSFCKKIQKNLASDSFVIKITQTPKTIKKVQQIKKYVQHHYDEDFNNPYADNIILEKLPTQKAHTNFYTFYTKECLLKKSKTQFHQ